VLLWIILGAVIAVVIGVALKVFFDRRKDPLLRISKLELVIGGVICCLVVVPATVKVGTAMIKANKLSFNEFLNGYEVKTDSSVTGCSRDGPCVREYHCDPYTVVDQEAYTDSDGHYHPEQSHTEYHDCPYATEEYTYTVDTTLGGFTIADHIFSDHPQEWRSGGGIPGDIDRGVPSFWQAATDRIAAGEPGPVTTIHHYDNYILASQSTILKKYSSSVEKFREAGLLPEPTQNAGDPIHDFYYADKITFIGPKGVTHPAEERRWSNALARFNAALGTDLQGDLHLAVADADIANPDEYANAVSAWWQDPAFGKNAISKNGIIVVLGVKDGVIQWARASTGMPYGNEAMLVDIRNGLKGQPFDSEAVLGDAGGTIAGDEVKPDHGAGLLAKIVWGPHKFERQCMLCNDEGEEGKTSFGYLGSEIQPSTGQKWLLQLIAALIGLTIWGTLVYVPLGEAGQDRRERRRRPRYY
jgi:hypothetical protein